MKLIMAAVAALVTAMIAIVGAPVSSAYPTFGFLGSELTMVDTVGQVTLSWTIKGLGPSTDSLPGYPVAGHLWEATATVKALAGAVTPAIPQFNARAVDDTNYRVLWQANTPNGISGATIAEGQQSSGKIYFDVTGLSPHVVALNNGLEDLLVWQP